MTTATGRMDSGELGMLASVMVDLLRCVDAILNKVTTCSYAQIAPVPTKGVTAARSSGMLRVV